MRELGLADKQQRRFVFPADTCRRGDGLRLEPIHSRAVDPERARYFGLRFPFIDPVDCLFVLVASIGNAVVRRRN
jgi:hypothetical protein